jgi:hypothetical protein
MSLYLHIAHYLPLKVLFNTIIHNNQHATLSNYNTPSNAECDQQMYHKHQIAS